MTDLLSGAAAGAENVRRLEAYLQALAENGQPLPERNGKVNVSAIAIACRFDRQVLYKNPAAKALLDEAVERLGFVARQPRQEGEPEQREHDPRDRRIHKLEQENASLRAELVGLRDRLRRLQHVEAHMVESGRRVAPMPLSLGEIGEK